MPPARPSPRPSPRSANLRSPSSSPDASVESPKPSGRVADQPTLDSLVTYFLASKRSLTSTSHVWRANELVTAAREALEENAVLAAKNCFVRRAIGEQLIAADAARKGVEAVAEEGKAECKAMVETLDVASMRLDEMIEVLRLTEIEPSFRSAAGGGDGVAQDERKSLIDFVEESGVTDLHNSIRASLDRVDVAHTTLMAHLSEFGHTITSIKGSYSAAIKLQTSVDEYEPPDQEGGASEVKASGSLDMSTEPASPVPSLFRNLEGHATECASLLQSLVRHYDLCVTALKHTEGGGAAIQRATGSLPTAQDDLPTGLGLEELHNDDDAPPAEPMDDEERADMIGVLMRDAAEVDDVVAEIADRLADMGESFAHIENYIASLRASARQLHRALVALSQLAAGMDTYVGASAEFLARWDEERAVLEAKADELDGLRDIYEKFARAYDALVVEVARRRNVQVRQEKVLKEALAMVDRLGREDAEERELFMQDRGLHLPSDIWAGLRDPPMRWDVVPLAEGLQSVPKISKDALERALQRARQEEG